MSSPCSRPAWLLSGSHRSTLWVSQPANGYLTGRCQRQRAGVPTLRPLLPGLAATAALAAVATVLGGYVPSLGAPVFAVVFGALLSGPARRWPQLRPGLTIARGFLLQLAVVLLGVQLSLRQVVATGGDSLLVLVSTLTVCFGLAYALGRRLGIDNDLRTLIAVGTGICGASAIAAVSPASKAKSADVAYAISAIFRCCCVRTAPEPGTPSSSRCADHSAARRRRGRRDRRPGRARVPRAGSAPAAARALARQDPLVLSRHPRPHRQTFVGELSQLSTLSRYAPGR